VSAGLADWYPGHTVLDGFVTAALAVSIVAAIAHITSIFLHSHPAVRHQVLLSGLLAALACPILATAFAATGWSFMTVPVFQTSKASTRVTPASGELASLSLPLPLTSTALLAGEVKASPIESLVANQEQVKIADRGALAVTFRTIAVAALLVWLSGTVLIVLRFVLSLRSLRQILRSTTALDAGWRGAIEETTRRLGFAARLNVGVSNLVPAPIAVGLFQPIIVLPRDLLEALTSRQLCDILVHEQTHIARRDHVVLMLQALAKALYWPIPCVHLLNRELNQAREEVCDNHVVAHTDAVSYGETLLRVAQLTRRVVTPAGTVGVLHWRGKLERRIARLIEGRSTMTRVHPVLGAFVLLPFLSIGLLLSGATVTSTRAEEPPLGQSNGNRSELAITNDGPKLIDGKLGQDSKATAPASELSRERRKAEEQTLIVGRLGQESKANVPVSELSMERKKGSVPPTPAHVPFVDSKQVNWPLSEMEAQITNPQHRDPMRDLTGVVSGKYILIPTKGGEAVRPGDILLMAEQLPVSTPAGPGQSPSEAFQRAFPPLSKGSASRLGQPPANNSEAPHRDRASQLEVKLDEALAQMAQMRADIELLRARSQLLERVEKGEIQIHPKK